MLLACPLSWTRCNKSLRVFPPPAATPPSVYPSSCPHGAWGVCVCVHHPIPRTHTSTIPRVIGCGAPHVVGIALCRRGIMPAAEASATCNCVQQVIITTNIMAQRVRQAGHIMHIVNGLQHIQQCCHSKITGAQLLDFYRFHTPNDAVKKI